MYQCLKFEKCILTVPMSFVLIPGGDVSHDWVLVTHAKEIFRTAVKQRRKTSLETTAMGERD